MRKQFTAILPLALLTLSSSVFSQTLVEETKNIYQNLKDSPVDLKLLVESDSTRRKGSTEVSGAYTLLTPTLYYKFTDTIKVGAFTESVVTRDNVQANSANYMTEFSSAGLRYDQAFFKADGWDASTSLRLFFRPTAESKMTAGDSGYVNPRFYANYTVNNDFKLKNELRFYVHNTGNSGNQNSKKSSARYYFTPTYIIDKDWSTEVEVRAESGDARNVKYRGVPTSTDFVHISPKVFYQLTPDWNVSTRLESKIVNSHDKKTLTKTNSRLELGTKYIPSRDFDVEFLISSQLYDAGKIKSQKIRDSYLMEMNLNVAAF